MANDGVAELLAADHENWTARLCGSILRRGFAAGSQVEQLKLQGRQVGRFLGWRGDVGHRWCSLVHFRLTVG